MKIHSILAMAAASVVVAAGLPHVAHAARSGSRVQLGSEPAARAQEGVRPLARPGQEGSVPLRRGAAPAPAPAGTSALAPVVTPDGEAAAPLDLHALLAEPDLDVRERNFDTVVARAAADGAVRAGLEQLTRDAERELAWTARLALREALAGPRDGAHDPAATPTDPFDALQRHLDGLLGGDPFSGPGGDPFELLEQLRARHPLGGSHFFGLGTPFGPGGPGASSGQDPFERMRAELDELRRALDAGPSGLPGGLPGGTQGGLAPRSGGTFQGRSQSLSMTPEGVRVQVTEEGPEGRTTRTYEAKTLEELYATYPELRTGLDVRVEGGAKGPGTGPGQPR